ncbi:uncharacterized protein LOC127725533 [Mytilus californianus]|uniref:uncharacterized protein LOC127725533 n=1 Tax=Mytilus californianus TaxID=6549 RepID=UPI00224725B1|nr:uncharacterized protein LOC127725533 [Mytilus californianus]
MAQVPLQNCEICEKNVGRRYCIDCEQYFCKTCEEFHLKSKSCRNHVFQDLEQINPEEKKVKCKEHNENMTYYCTTCSMLACKICLPKRHTKHDFTLTSEAAFKLKTDLKEKIEQTKIVVGLIEQQRTTLEGKTNKFIRSNERLIQAISQKGSELKNIVDKIVCDKVANVTTEEQVNLQKKTDEERILKDAQEKGEMIVLKVTNAVENQGDTILLNSHQALQQAMQSMPDIVKSDMEFPALTFEDGLLNEITLTEMIGSVMISKTALDRGLDKKHFTEGARLQVKKHIPPTTYPNTALVIKINSKTTHVELINFLETRTKLDVEEVYFADKDSHKAVVTFSGPIDIEDIQTACKKKALDGNYLTVYPVVVTNCIIVRGFSKKTTESKLEYYFDNKRRSGVDGIADIKMNKDEDYCLVYFDNAEDALLACERSHTIYNCKLNVEVYYDCLGVSVDSERLKFKPLPPLILSDIDIYKVQFLARSTQYREMLEQQLELSHAKITWPSSTSDSMIVIECTLTKDTENCRKLTKSWEEDIRKKLCTHVDALVTKKHTTQQETWNDVMLKLRQTEISDPKSVTVTVEKPPICGIIIVGHEKAVKEVSDIIKQFSNENA